MAKTLANVIASVRARLPKWDSGLETELNSHLEEVIRDICKQYPYWFLKVNPGAAFAASFFPGDEASLAAATPVKGNWLGRGWLRVDEGTSRYLVYSPAVPGPDHDSDGTKWFATPVQRIDSVYVVEPEGTLTGTEIPCYNAANSFEATGGSKYSSGSSELRQVVWENVMESGETVTYLNIFPEPTKDFLLAFNYTVQYAADYTIGASSSNSLFLNYYETAVAAGMLMAADYFSDAPLQEYWMNKLYGKKPVGLIAGMKKDTITMPFKDRMVLKPNGTNPATTRRELRGQRRYNWRR